MAGIRNMGQEVSPRMAAARYELKDRARQTRGEEMICSHFDGVIAWVTWRLSNGRLEGMNNKIRLLSHRSFGLHSAEALISLVYLNCGGLTLERIH